MSIDDYCSDINRRVSGETYQKPVLGIRKLNDGKIIEYTFYNSRGTLITNRIYVTPERIWEAVREIERDRLNGAIS